MADETLKSIRARLYIDGKPAEGSIKAVKQESQKLKLELDLLVKGTDAWNAKMKEVQANTKVLNNVKKEIEGLGGAFGWLKTEIGKLGVLAVGTLGFQFVTAQFQNIIAANAKLSDSLADIRKTTGMSEDAVRRLQSSFKTIDTRSSRADLNSLAEVAGKLGISGEKDVLGFVKAADQINVALGKDLGNAESAINDLGKLTEIFHIKDAYGLEGALLKTGSAINDLGAAGTANEGYIVEFTKRMGGIAPAAKISIQDIMGMAATMDELGQPAEAATTAIGQFIVGLGKDIPRFAGIAKLSVQEFTDLLNTDGNAALIAVLQNLKSTNGGVAALAENMGLAGEDGAKAVQALGLLSNNLELLATRQDMANASFEKGTSLTNEFNIKNNNFAATLEKVGKKFSALTSNTTITDWLVKVVTATGSLLDFLNRNINTIASLIKMVTAGAVAYAAYNTVVLLTKVTQKEWLEELLETEMITKLVAAAQTAWTVILLVCQGRLRDARNAMIEFNAASEANPIGLVIAAISGLVVAIKLFKTEANSAAEIQEMLNRVQDKAAESIADEKEKLETLQGILKSDTALRETKLQAVARLKEMMPDHLKGYSDEQILAGKAAISINQYIRSLERRAEAEAAFDEMKQLKQQRAVVERDGVDNNAGQYIGVVLSDIFGGQNSGQKLLLENEKKNKEQTIKALDDKIKTLKENFKADFEKNVTNGNVDGAGGFNLATANKSQLDAQLVNDAKALKELTRGGKEYVAVAKEMAAIRLRLKEIDKDTGIGGKGPDPKKKAQTVEEASAALTETLTKFNERAVADLLSKNEKELQSTADKYADMIRLEQAFLARKDITTAQRTAHELQLGKLQTDQTAAVNAVRLRQEKDTNDQIAQLHQQLGNKLATELDRETDLINQKYQAMLDDGVTSWEQWASIQINWAKELADAQINEEKRLLDEIDRIKEEGAITDEDRQKIKLAKINQHYDAELAALDRNYSEGLRKTKKYQDAKDAILNNKAGAIQLANDEDPAEKKRKEEEIAARTKKSEAEKKAAEETANAIFAITSRNRNADTDAKIRALESERDTELKNKKLTQKQKDEINAKFAQKEADVKRQAWEAQKMADIESAIINGALAMTKVTAQTGVLSFVFDPIIALQTAAQVALIAAQPTPQFAEGGSTDEDPAGFVSQATLFNRSASGRPFVAGEAGKEWIAPNWMVKSPRYANLIGMLEMARKEKRAYATGGYNDNAGTKANSDFLGGSARLDRIEASMINLQSLVMREAEKNIVFNDSVYQEKKRKDVQIRDQATL